MKRIRIGAGAVLMLAAMLISDRAGMLFAYFLSATLHECGHLIAAGALGIRIREIRLEFSGIRIYPEEGLRSYRDELLLALAGPSVNFFIMLGCVFLFAVSCISLGDAVRLTHIFLSGGEYSHVGAIGFFAVISLIQGATNLLPINSFDGGRIIYCVFALLFSVYVAERVTDATSAFSAFILWTIALYVMIKVGAGLGIYVFSICLFVSSLQDHGRLREYEKKA